MKNMLSVSRSHSTVYSPVLQRKCACGQHTIAGGECEACRKKRLQRKAHSQAEGTAVPTFAPTIHTFQEPRFDHDFSQIRLQTPRLREVSPVVKKLYQGKNGDTGCDVSVGTPSTTLYDPPACYRACVERHEKVHATDLSPCCKRANSAYKAAKSDEAKGRLQEKFNEWVKANEDWFECRGYAESARCAKEYVDKNCGAKQAEGISEAPSSDEELTPFNSLRTGMIVDGTEAEASTALAEEEDKETPSPEQCCPSVKNYRRVSKGRSDTACGRAKKNLSPCPF